MLRGVTQAKSWFVRMAVVAFIVLGATAAQADTWRGTAPFCEGRCLPGETQVASSNCGNGACCWSGRKVLCRNDAPTCTGRQTKTSCKGVVMICDNGFYEVGPEPPVWRSCAKYACGVCFGFDF